MEREIEVKIAMDDAKEAEALLLARGAVAKGARELEDNVLYDQGGALAREGKLLRLRRVGSRAILTVKAPEDAAHAGAAEARAAASAAYKVRRELETAVDDPDALEKALNVLGYRPVWRYQKWRRTFELEGAEVVLDELPLGTYLEIEGEPAAIDRAARALGLGRERWETASYREIHERRSRARGVVPGDLVFPPPGADPA